MIEPSWPTRCGFAHMSPNSECENLEEHACLDNEEPRYVRGSLPGPGPGAGPGVGKERWYPAGEGLVWVVIWIALGNVGPRGVGSVWRAVADDRRYGDERKDVYLDG